MTTGERQITEWAGQCRAGQLSRRDLGQRLLRMTGSVPVVLAVLHGLGIPAEAHEVVEAPQNDILRCSFCSKDKDQITQLIAGPSVFICNECVDVCNDIIADDNRFAAKHGATER